MNKFKKSAVENILQNVLLEILYSKFNDCHTFYYNYYKFFYQYK